MKWLFLLIIFITIPTRADSHDLIPKIDGEWWTIAHDPDLGELTDPKQQPVDFAIWQSADGSWQLCSCIRHTKEPGYTRLLYRWEGKNLTDPDWKPMGIFMHADPNLGEAKGGLQAPYVLKHDGNFLMFYGDWDHICIAQSDDGKTFTRRVNPDGHAGMFTQGPGANTRDPMAIRIGDLWHCYYAAGPDKHCAVFCRTSRDLVNWSDATKVAYGGEAGIGGSSAECPFVVSIDKNFYLFRTQKYGENAITRVYVSQDPMDFGVEHDEGHLLTSLPVAAPEILQFNGQWFIAALRADLKGIQVARLKWEAK